MALQGPPGPHDPRLSVTEWAKTNKKAAEFSTEKRWLYPAAINGGRWNRLYPYQLVVVDQTDQGTYVIRPPDAAGTSWVFTLPMPPESLQVSTPFAINTTATLGGYVEEHNGIVFRMLSLTGSLGVFFGRGEAPSPPDFSSYNTKEAIFAGVLPGTTAAFNATKASVNEFFNGRSFATNAVEQSTFNDPDDNGALTGFYQFRLLQLFLEAYSELKRSKKGTRSRLAFAMWKQEEIYLCTPVSFDYQRSAGVALEYRYSLVLKASKRVKLAPGAADIVQTYTPIQRDPGKLAAFLNKVQQARLVLQNARKTITAVGGDVEASLFTPMRELTLFAKDALAAPLAVADLANSLIYDMRDAVIDLYTTYSDASDFLKNAAIAGKDVSQNAHDADALVRKMAAEQKDNSVPTVSRQADPGNTPFRSPLEYYDYFSNLPVGSLNLRPATVAKIAAERSRVRQLTRLDFEKRRDAIAQTAADISNALGIGSATYNEVYGITPPANPPVTIATDDDYEAVYAMNSLIIEINRLVVTSDTDPNPKLDSIAVVAGLAQRSGIAFTTPRSKFAVPFPYGSTLEMLAARYLGDPNRWFEIVALNGLQTPYVDEEGFRLPLLVGGAGNTVMVADASQLFIGQPVWIESVGVARTKRRITKLDRLSTNQILVTVDGDPNLDAYTTMARAFVHAFLPNTLNSQMVVYIPSATEPKDDDFKTKAIPDIDEYDRLLAVGGIDLLLTPQNDLVITPSGDTRWAVGLTNITQKVRLALSVVQGTLLGHPEYGLPIAVGQSLADVDATDMVRAINDLFNGDPTFAGVQGAHVAIDGPAARLGLGVVIAGTSQVIPISAEVKQ